MSSQLIDGIIYFYDDGELVGMEVES